MIYNIAFEEVIYTVLIGFIIGGGVGLLKKYFKRG